MYITLETYSFRDDMQNLESDAIILEKCKLSFIPRFLSKIFTKYRIAIGRSSEYDIVSKRTLKKVGNLLIGDNYDGQDCFYINWIDVKSKSQGCGYATEALKLVLSRAKELGFKKAVLECVGTDVAHHLYEKLGFKETKVLTTPEEDPLWDGLTQMELDLTTYKG